MKDASCQEIQGAFQGQWRTELRTDGNAKCNKMQLDSMMKS